MKRMQRIHKLLNKNFNDFIFEIKDNSSLHVGHHNFNGFDETHIEILLNTKNFEKINRLEIHKKINNLLAKEFEKGLHSIEIKINQL